MKHNRWYDKYENLRHNIEALKEMSQSYRNTVALDMIQLMLKKQHDKDNFLEIMNKNNLAKERRWYDEDYMFHSAIEMLRYFSPEETEELFKETITSLTYEGENHQHDNLSWQ